ncbi:hypothetical protein GCM10009554_69210 [Kribbella koreensis]|uniref:Sec-independent protein translocase protein TatA n=1 Tax=Kribbella koreensis TaxID=57909 RepID=A0ABN1RIF3_9ACTN
MIAQLIALHMGGVPEAAMFLGPILLIIAFVRIARRNDANAVDDEDDWDADLGDIEKPAEPASEPSPRLPGRS